VGTLLAASFVGATVLTFWLGYRATREWDRYTAVSVQTRGSELLALLTVALERDMTGGQLSVLLPVNQPLLDQSSLYDLADRFAGGFARFPYMESVFVWKDTTGPEGLTYFFNRAGRLPPWDTADGEGDLYPVVVRRNPMAVRPLVTLARSQAAGGAPFALFETVLDGTRYQTLVQLLYTSGRAARLVSMVGFTVSLDWVRQHYFHELMHQIAKISGNETIRLEIVDDNGRLVSEAGPAGSGVTAQTRTFRLAFADRSVSSIVSPSLRIPTWTARVDVSRDATLMAAERGTTRTLGLLALGAISAVVALILTVRASRAAVRLATRQSEFVSSVSHEMKTPLSLITLASDSLANGRYSSPETIGHYGRLLGVEARQLTRLIDNVLCYARLSDAQESSSFEALDITELIGDSVERFRLQFAALGCDVEIDSPPVVPTVRGDRTMLGDLLDNVVDNALKYGGSGRLVNITVRPYNGRVRVDISDRGGGIPADEMGRVFDKFYRVKGTQQRGSGLGLTIARKIVEEHEGTIDIKSEFGRGTSVTIEIPCTRH
jgi:signal transduction histidine kinase